MSIRRSTRLRTRSKIQVPEVTSSTASIQDEESNLSPTRSVSPAPLEIQNDDSATEEPEAHESIVDQASDAEDSDNDAPDEISFAKAKEDFVEESHTIKSVISQHKKRRILPNSVLAVVSQDINNTPDSPLEDEDAVSDEDDLSDCQPPRIRAVTLKSIDSTVKLYNNNSVDIDSVTVKSNKFSKVKLGPAAEFLVKRS